MPKARGRHAKPTLISSVWQGLQPRRYRDSPLGFRMEIWSFSVRDHTGKVVDKGERWLLSDLESHLAARYLAVWWTEDRATGSTDGWGITIQSGRTRATAALTPTRPRYVESAHPTDQSSYGRVLRWPLLRHVRGKRAARAAQRAAR